MTAPAWLFLGVAAALAIADWIAVSPPVEARPAEYVLKPATLVTLVVLAAAIRPENDAQRAIFVGALVLSLAGDVFLMLPRDMFVAGLGSFLLAHVAYIIGFAIAAFSVGAAAAGLALVVLAAGAVCVRIVRAVLDQDRALAAPVVVYMTVISAMVVVAIGSREPFAVGGALLFYGSDSLIAWDRFVRPIGWARPAIMSTYHLAQAALVVSLVR